MPRRTGSDLREVPLSLVYIAGTVAEAEKAERVLTERGVDYVLSLEPFASTSLMRTGEHTGLFVYVPTGQHESCRNVLERSGLTDTVGLDEDLLMEKPDGA